MIVRQRLVRNGVEQCRPVQQAHTQSRSPKARAYLIRRPINDQDLVIWCVALIMPVHQPLNIQPDSDSNTIYIWMVNSGRFFASPARTACVHTYCYEWHMYRVQIGHWIIINNNSNNKSSCWVAVLVFAGTHRDWNWIWVWLKNWQFACRQSPSIYYRIPLFILRLIIFICFCARIFLQNVPNSQACYFHRFLPGTLSPDSELL